jgi:succinate dehydrogenase/fumarate reductase cytochrome b subunit
MLDIFAPDTTKTTCPYCPTTSPPPHTGNDIVNATPNGSKDAPPAASSSRALPPDVLETLPTIRHADDDMKTVIQISDDIQGFVAVDLNVDRLNDIHGSLWRCGRPMNARGLHRQILENRSIVKTEQADLHLLYYDKILLLKPLPSYLLCQCAWDLYLNHDKKLHKLACGFLLSYIWLIRSPVDFKLAEEAHLLPSHLTWPKWKKLVVEFLKVINPDSLDQVNKRYHFGELRLGRINTIYRTNPKYFFKYFVRGYLYNYNRYVVFFQRNVGWVLVVFVWFSLILSAMQVGTTVMDLTHNTAFNKASFGFVVFSIVMVAALLVFVGTIFVAVFLYNMVAAISHKNSAAKWRKKLSEARKNKDV